MKPTYRNVSAAHPLGGCRMADSKDFGVVDHRGEVFGYEGLFCMDSSSIPTSLGVNPSLTISAVAERACEQLIARERRLRAAGPPGRLQARACPACTLGPHADAAPAHVGRRDRREGPQLRLAVGALAVAQRDRAAEHARVEHALPADRDARRSAR